MKTEDKPYTMRARLPGDEAQRLRALADLRLLDTAREQDWDDLAVVAAAVCDTPIALVTLIDDDRQWFKANIGLAADQTDRDSAFCAHAILDDETLIVRDATVDPRFQDNPLVHGEPFIRFYAGAPFSSPDGHRLGTVCAIDRRPRSLNEGQVRAMSVLARQATELIRLRALAIQLQEDLAAQPGPQQAINEASHELNTPLTPIILQVHVLKRRLKGADLQRLLVIEAHVQRLQAVISGVISSLPRDAPKHPPRSPSIQEQA